MDTMKGREQNPNSGRTGGSPEEKLDAKQTEFPLRRKGTRRDGSGTINRRTKMNGTVYVVHCIDTEGPLYEEPKVPFEQIKNIFGIEIAPTRENLIKLQKGELDLGGKEEAVRNLVDIHKITTRGSWEDIQEMLAQVTSEKFRQELPDSKGNGWVFNWFCMDHVGFTGNNPRRRDGGHHKIFDRYREMILEQKQGDGIGFHHHPVPFSGNYNESGTAFWGGENLNQILCRKIIDRQWFPTTFRPGFHTERPDSHWFLEQWIPFDFGNQSVRMEETDQPDLSEGRFGDWRHAPLEWHPYHPAHEDYQKKGACNRWITRCLNMYARIRQITLKDVEEAFETAQAGKNVLLAFTDHDYKDMYYEINRVRDMIGRASQKYRDVCFEYADAVSAMRRCLNLPYEDLNLNVEIQKDGNVSRLVVSTETKIFGPQPFLALKTKQGLYLWDNFDFAVPGKEWSYTFDNNTVELEAVEAIGIAANNSYGICQVILSDTEGQQKKYKYNM